MEKDNNHSEYIAQLLASLNDDKMSMIDFDHLRTWLAKLSGQLCSEEGCAGELKVLRDDYSQRIGGMVKAIAAVDRKRDSWPEALSLVESLDSMKAGDLVICYRKVTARFRDHFPASFGLLRDSQSHGQSREDLSVYK